MSIYRSLGSRPVINASGIYTDLGGAILAPSVWQAMTSANETFADMPDLLASTGRLVAGWLGTEAARITPGASAGIALSVAGCLTRGDGPACERLPDLTGLERTEVVIQHGHRYKYDRLVRLPGATLVEVGGASGTTPAALAAAFGSRTVATLFPAHLDGAPGTVGLDETIALAHAAGIPVVVDAAYQVEPPERMETFSARGADLTCFSAKYFRGPNGGGIVAGRVDRIAAVAAVDFVRHESGPYRRFGRAFKMDRQIVIGTVEALRAWREMDHAARLVGYRAMVDELKGRLSDVAGVQLEPVCFTMAETYEPEPVNALFVRFPEPAAVAAAALDTALRDGDPSIRAIEEADGVAIVVETLEPSDVAIVADRIRAAVAP